MTESETAPSQPESPATATSAVAASRVASRTHTFTESVIREMTRIARECGALNLAQGFPDFPAPDVLKEAACDAIRADVNQYAVTWGAPELREAIADSYLRTYGMEVDTERHITVTCGATEAMAAVVMALIDPGDEVIVPEPFYENYGPDAVLAGATPRFLSLDPPDFALDPDRIEALVGPRTRAIILNTPNNPTGRVFTREEMEGVADVCRRHDLIAITDEIYEHIVYEGRHIPLATLEGMRDRTVTISGASKTYSITGWRIGTIVAPADLTDAIRKVHDFLTVGAPAPLQVACAHAMRTLGDEYYTALERDYRARRDVLYEGLTRAGYQCSSPHGAYYILADFGEIRSDVDDTRFAHELTRDGGVAPVPGSSFFHQPGAGSTLVRFAFCKRIETLRDAAERLEDYSRRFG